MSEFIHVEAQIHTYGARIYTYGGPDLRMWGSNLHMRGTEAEVGARVEMWKPIS